MHKLNHFVFSVGLCLIFLELNPINLLFIFVFSIIFSCLIDYDHHPLILRKLKLKKPWYHRRTWIQELGGFLIIGLPIAFILASFSQKFFIFVTVPYLSHVFLDYLCIFPAYPLAPFLKIKKPEGLGIFYPQNFQIFGSLRSNKWKRRVEIKKIKAISENYFLLLNLIFLFLISIYKFL